MHPDHRPYWRHTSRSRLEKAVNSLLGLVEGIAIDGTINEAESRFLADWLREHEEFRSRHPFNELAPAVERAVADKVLSEDEREELAWLCKRLTSQDFFDEVTADLQRLHAVMGGIIADMQISEAELRGLREWLDDHEHLKTVWPYDEIDSLVTGVMQDQKIDEGEHKLLHSVFSEFVAIMDGRTITKGPVKENRTIVGLCATQPDIQFKEQSFCFTGASMHYQRDQLADVVVGLGGEFLDTLSKKVNYLVIGAKGNPCWAYACYGRKVEKAVELRKQGHRIVIVHELDFHEAASDHVRAANKSEA